MKQTQDATDGLMNLGGRYVCDIEKHRSEFAQYGFTKLEGFLDRSIEKFVKQQIARAQFSADRDYIKGGVLTGRDEVSQSPPYSFLHILLNGPESLLLASTITQIEGLETFIGRLYRNVPGKDHFLSWHDDLDMGRSVALSLNLSPSPYEGGTLQMRSRKRLENILEIPNLRFGDAIIFRIAEGLEHRLTRVIGSHPKIAYSGWFRKPLQPKVQRR